ncbi:unnamed protein product [Onchocerca ochengi]|uniref:Hva1_TUDOR domain-containing protein n=1 Tax=Onchocerca ochengi TaxID=42157 RepID=A0A182EHP2_ONCOC|nr:unnamed protein product [Onchocerca ochengi]
MTNHITSRWDGIPLSSQSALLEAEDGTSVITDTIKEDETGETKTFVERTRKVPLTTYSMKELTDLNKT